MTVGAHEPSAGLTPLSASRERGVSARRVVPVTRTAERLLQSLTHQHPTSVSPDGTQVVFTDVMKNEVMMLSLHNRHLTPLVQTPFAQRNGDISPDGRWLAYGRTSRGSRKCTCGRFLM